METTKLTVLGKSDAVITMILDNLESQNLFPEIEIVNNFNLSIIHRFDREKFKISIKSKIEDYNSFFLGVNKSHNKFCVFSSFAVEPAKFINIVHKSSSISTTAKMKHGCLINSLVSVAAYAKLGNFVSLNRNSSVGHHSVLEDFVTVQPGSNIAGFVRIGSGTIVGMGANVLDGINIGKNSIIGAGSLVNKNIPDNVVAYGVPCKVVRENNEK